MARRKPKNNTRKIHPASQARVPAGKNKASPKATK
jgi:hypothetical protein